MAESPCASEQRLVEVVLDDEPAARLSPDVQHERRVAIFDLLESNHFAPVGVAGGPYVLRLTIVDNRLVFDIDDEAGARLASVNLPMSPFRAIMRDYAMVCDSYLEAIRSAPRSRIEAIDMGRRGLHNEGSELLRDKLADSIDVDFDTARRLFTLIYVLHMRR